MAEQERYRFRGSIKPSAEVKQPVKAYRNETVGGSNGSKSTSATIDIFDVIDSWGGWWGISAAEVDAALTDVGKVDTLYVRVNSPGGEATEGVAIANLLRAHAAKIHVTVYGLAASAASYISTAGDSVSMAPGSMMMVHCAWNVIRGNAEDLRGEAVALDKLDESIASLYALKAGGALEDWLALMRVETWFTAADAVEAKLADKVGIETSPLPANVEPAVPAEPGDDDATPFDRAARVFDLSVFAHPPAANAAHKSPAEPPEKHPQPKEAVIMTPDEIKALRERLGLAENADTAAINAKLDELEEQATKPDTPTEVTEEQALAALAKAHNVKAEDVKGAVTAAAGGEPTAPEGKVIVSETLLEELKANAKLGADARGKQLQQERDDAIDAAFRAGKISADRRDTWRNAWDKDPEGTKADLDSLEARFPVGQARGYAGGDGTDGDGTKPFTDEEAEQLAALTGTPKEALING